jgi:hypothetical protein
MSWFPPKLRNSLYGLLGHSSQPTTTILDMTLEDIRESMLNLLADCGPGQFPHVTRRIRYALDLQGLWYLRGDLMAALASRHGEAAARERIQSVTDMFRGMLPGGLGSRPSSLIG